MSETSPKTQKSDPTNIKKTKKLKPGAREQQKKGTGPGMRKLLSAATGGGIRLGRLEPTDRRPVKLRFQLSYESKGSGQMIRHNS